MIKQMFIKLDNSVLELVEKLQVSMKTPSLDSQWIPARLPRYVKGDVKRLGFSFVFFPAYSINLQVKDVLS